MCTFFLEEIERHASDITMPTGINMPKRLKAAIVEVRRIQAHHWALCGVIQGTIDAFAELGLTEAAVQLNSDMQKLGIDLKSHTAPDFDNGKFYKRVG